MPASRLDPIVKHLRQAMLRQQIATLTDGQLLEQFIAGQDAAAFEALVRRHGPMVLGVCRRVLGNIHDAEDAFQASFLVLARKAASVKPREAVGNWLYGVANTTALRAKVSNAKRRVRERQVRDMPEPASTPRNPHEELLALLDQELARLADKYRLPIVLCDLEGRTRKDVARQLKIPEGTISSRLATGRRLLAKRLARHGVEATGVSLDGVLTCGKASAFVPPGLIAGTVKAAGFLATGQTAAACVASAQVTILMEGVLKMMLVRKLKIMTAAFLGIALTCFGVSGVTRQAAGRSESPTNAPARQGKPALAYTPKALEALQGVWKVVSIESGDGPGTLKAFFLVDGNRACWQTGGSDIEGGLYLDPTSSPKAFDLATSKKTFEGIYELRGNTLRLCFDHAEEAPRPTQFAVRPGSRQVLVVLKCEARGRINFRRADGSRGFPDLVERPTPIPPPPAEVPAPPAVVQQPSSTSHAKATGKVRIGRIIIVGNERTPDAVIRSCLQVFPGQRLDMQALKQAEKALADLKLFVVDRQKGIWPTVSILREGNSSFVDVLVNVTEPQLLNQDADDIRQVLGVLKRRLSAIKDDVSKKELQKKTEELEKTLRRLESSPEEGRSNITPLGGTIIENADTKEDARDFSSAEFYERAGHPAAAIFYYELILRRYPGTNYADLAEKRLSELRRSKQH